MNNSTSTNSSAAGGGIGVLGMLGITFVVLKLIGVIDWSWWLVTAPFWGGFAAFAVLLIVGFFFVLIIQSIKGTR